MSLSKRVLMTAVVGASQWLTGAAAMAGLSFTVDANGWPSTTHRNAAVDALQSAVNRYNAYGDFGNYNVYAYYNAGIPTAQANYLGSIGYGGTYPNERVTLHEMSHYLGTGTYGTPWDGTRAEGIVDQFDGLEATLNGDSAHYWPYGLNYDNEGSEINKQRHVALLYAMRADMGIGSTANPAAWAATQVTLTASDALGTSGFNYPDNWSDHTFAHPNAHYATGNNLMRTPASGNSFNFVGSSLTINNTNGINGGLLYKGTGSTGVTTFQNLTLDGGYVRHANAVSDVFRVAGKVTLKGSPTIDAAQGSIVISADIGGSGSLTKVGSYPVILSGNNTYTGDTFINAQILRIQPLTPVASYSFDQLSGNTVLNGGTGAGVMNGTLANGASIVANGQSGNAVQLSGGASVDINHPIIDMGPGKSWTMSAWIKTRTPGASILTKGDGGWGSGNTIFYLGDGTGGGSGGIPSGVRYAGGFFQGSTAAPSLLDNAWHQVSYVNNAGTFMIYVDGVAIPLAPGNSGFGNDDIGSIVRLGVSTNTIAADGTVNFNGLLDGVQFYSQALSASQINALMQGNSLLPGALPVTTTVHIASGATLEANRVMQEIAGLNGPSGSTATFADGMLIVNAAGTSTFSGNLGGTNGKLVKKGAGTLVLRGTNSYSGGTTIEGGTLIIGNNARTPILGAGAAGADIRGGKLVFDYAGGTTPAATVLSILDAGYDLPAKFSTGQLRDTLLPEGLLLGWRDDASTQSLTVLATLAGDINLDRAVDFDDLLLLAQNYGVDSDRVWSQGDTNYDGSVNFDDLLALAQHYGQPATFASDWALAQWLVPEPAALSATLGGIVLFRRRRRTHA